MFRRRWKEKIIIGGLCIAIGSIVMLCYIPFWIWMLLLGLSLAIVGTLLILC